MKDRQYKIQIYGTLDWATRTLLITTGVLNSDTPHKQLLLGHVVLRHETNISYLLRFSILISSLLSTKLLNQGCKIFCLLRTSCFFLRTFSIHMSIKMSCIKYHSNSFRYGRYVWRWGSLVHRSCSSITTLCDLFRFAFIRLCRVDIPFV